MFFIRLLQYTVQLILYYIMLRFHTNSVASDMDVMFCSQAHPQADMLSPRAGSHSGLLPAARRPLLQRQKSSFQPEWETFNNNKKNTIPLWTSLKIHFSQFPFKYETSKELLELAERSLRLWLFWEECSFQSNLLPGRFLWCQTCSEYS